MAYTTREKITARIPSDFVERIAPEPTEENADDVLADIIATIETEIDGYLDGRYTVPLSSPIPPVIQNAALILTCHALFLRGDRTDDGNPWAKAADEIRQYLAEVRDGTATLVGLDESLTSSFNSPTLIFDRT